MVVPVGYWLSWVVPKQHSSTLVKSTPSTTIERDLDSAVLGVFKVMSRNGEFFELLTISRGQGRRGIQREDSKLTFVQNMYYSWLSNQIDQ